MINQKCLEQWIEIKKEIDRLQDLIKLDLDLYLNTQDIRHLRTMINDINEIISKIDRLQDLIKLDLDLYLNTQDIRHLRTIINDINEIIRKTTTEQELYQKTFNQI